MTELMCRLRRKPLRQVEGWVHIPHLILITIMHAYQGLNVQYLSAVSTDYQIRLINLYTKVSMSLEIPHHLLSQI